MQEKADIVIIGAGIVGCSAAHFLAKKGWKNIVVIDQGPLFETGGSTSHAPGLVFELNSSKTMCQLAKWSVETYRNLQWDGLPCYYPVGSLEIANTPKRWQDLQIKWGRSLAWQLQADLISKEEVMHQIPFANPELVYGALSVPTDGIAKAMRIVQSLAHDAMNRGVLFYGNTEVTGIHTDNQQIQGVQTSNGTIQTSKILVCAGIWGPNIAKMAGIKMALTPVEHQYVQTGPIKEFLGTTQEVTLPILRNQDYSLYFRQHFDSIGIGSYFHQPLLAEPSQIGKSATRPFTTKDFGPAFAHAYHLYPSLEGVPWVQKFNGMFSFTPDGNSLLGETSELKGFWVAEAVWVTHGAGAGKVIADLISGDIPDIDLREVDVNRFATHATSPEYIRTRGAQQYREVYDIIHPLQQIEQLRPLRVSPFYERQKALGAIFFESSGWERPQWFENNSSLPPCTHLPQRDEWNSRYSSAIISQEHQTTREQVAIFDLSAFSKFEIAGPGALAYLQQISANQIDQPINKIVYTAMLNQKGGIMCDLTITRRAHDRFWVITGGSVGMHDRAWMQEHLPRDHSVHLSDLTSSYCCLGVWGPKARLLIQSVSENNLSHESFPYYSAQSIYIGSVPCFALRISYAGELGWEIYTSSEYGLSLWDTLWKAGQPLGIIAAGGGAFDSLRLEKGYRLWGADIHSEYHPFEAGLGFAVKLSKPDFIGKSALEKYKSDGITRKLCCLILNDSNTVLLGKEPLLINGQAIGYVSSANFGYSIGKSILYGYLPIQYANLGQTVETLYLGKKYTATVNQEPLFDPTHSRLKS